MFRSRRLSVSAAMKANEQTAIAMVAAGVGVTLCRPLTDAGTASTVIMNYRAGDQSAELARSRDLVKTVLKHRSIADACREKVRAHV